MSQTEEDEREGEVSCPARRWQIQGAECSRLVIFPSTISLFLLYISQCNPLCSH